MQAEMQVARQRLSVMVLTQKLGNVSDTCRRRWMRRAECHEYMKLFEMQELAGLKDPLPVHGTHPQPASPEVEDQ